MRPPLKSSPRIPFSGRINRKLWMTSVGEVLIKRFQAAPDTSPGRLDPSSVNPGGRSLRHHTRGTGPWLRSPLPWNPDRGCHCHRCCCHRHQDGFSIVPASLFCSLSTASLVRAWAIVKVVSDWQVMWNNKRNKTLSTLRRLLPIAKLLSFKK